MERTKVTNADLDKDWYDFELERRASKRAGLDLEIELWKEEWKDENLHIFVYGDFRPPDSKVEIGSLGITIDPRQAETNVIENAKSVLNAVVKVKTKSVESLVDATRRINILMGVWSLLEWGDCSIGWYSIATHGGSILVSVPYEKVDIINTVDEILKLPKPLAQKINAALYWINIPRVHFKESYRSGLFNRYTAYWNAFECLVEASNLHTPRHKLSRPEKKQLIDKRLSERNGSLTASDIQELYQKIVNPGFVGKAIHALQVCFQKEANKYILDCFKMPDKGERLYDIRNALNHGDVDASDPDEVFRIGSRLIRLRMIVWHMFRFFIKFPSHTATKMRWVGRERDISSFASVLD